MSSQALQRTSFSDRAPSAEAFATASWRERLIAGSRALLARWLERRRARLAYRRDLETLACLGERELADCQAPAWLVADVQRYRHVARVQGSLR